MAGLDFIGFMVLGGMLIASGVLLVCSLIHLAIDVSEALAFRRRIDRIIKGSR